MAFIDDHAKELGIEPICRELQVAPSSYHEHAVRLVDPDKRSAREDIDGAVFLAVARKLTREGSILRLVAGGDGAARFKQGPLVLLELGDQVIARRQRRRECFFEHARHPL